MTRRGKLAISIVGLSLAALFAVAEFVFPNYVTRLSARIIADARIIIYGIPPVRDDGLTDDSIQSNEFIFQFTALEDAPTQRAAGVLGPDTDGQFEVVDRAATVIAGQDITPVLEALDATYPTAVGGGVKQVIEIDGALFVLLGLESNGCYFAALADMARLEVVDQFPCLADDPDNPDDIAINSLGGAYAIDADGALVLALGTGSSFTWNQANGAAQSPDSPYGKMLRYDIVTETDGPRLENRQILSTGHRNPQGMARFGDLLLAVEHGPMGGDEINVITPGANFGWPLFSAGSQYNQRDLTAFASDGSGFSNPMFTFVPSIATSDISPCPSLIATRYAGADCAIVSGLISRALFIVLGDFAEQRVRSVERIDVGLRVREVFLSDDTMYLLADDASLVRVGIEARPCDPDRGPCTD